ncbi:DeoR/GlpR family DNA-binding transcription regulator [Bosea minatitlanensis]|uniref:DeoR/GlpR family DNA-binding transcription regulator n=1 Tax=Bosea minatitlanensis TaxID=128782 RepID=A0ABW0F3S0_9HYPH|nr:DeoR/GlpR family DNA-binding transcription regulator [Bosea minatitlanensis]MCT4493399.1 DeoR/GlpR family DNA-binding transcription regulator [Bosea minatitlanensis]
MLERERHRLIVKLTNERSIIALSDLVDMLDASEATIRRDIAALDRNGELRRVRGGAEALRPRHQHQLAGVPFAMSRDVNVAQKEAIAREAAMLIEDGMSVILNAGSTTFELARLLRGRSLDVLTNSFSIASELLSARPGCRVTIPSGTVYPEHNIILSSFEHDGTESFAGEILFMSCYGLGRAGATEMDPLIARAAQKLVRRAERVVVLADSSKLRMRSSMLVAPLEDIDIVITDSGAGEAEIALLRSLCPDVRVMEAAAGGKASAMRSTS